MKNTVRTVQLNYIGKGVKEELSQIRSLHTAGQLRMPRIAKFVFRYAVVLFSVLLLNVQKADSQTIPVSLKVYFRQNVSTLEPSFRDNAWRMEDFVRYIQNAIADSLYTIDNIDITSTASPEGPFAHNIELSRNRGAALRDYLSNALDVPYTFFNINALGEDWEGLRRLVQQYDVPNKNKVLKIIDEYLASPVKNQELSARCKTAIEQIDGSKAANYIYEHIYPELRNASNAVVCYLKPTKNNVQNIVAKEPVPARDTIYIVQQIQTSTKDTVFVVMQGGMGAGDAAGTEGFRTAPLDSSAYYLPYKPAKVRKENRYHFAAKTNLLFDLTSALNVELEFPIKNKVSLMLEHNFPWWLPVFGDKHYSMELLRTGIEARYWFGDRKKAPLLTGWFVGAYGSADYYDFEWQNRGWQGETFFDFGVSGGYSFKIAENWRIETSLGLGYFKSNYTEYDHRLDVGLLVYQKDGTFTWIGPTKLKCSISWIIPNFPTEKSKARKAAKEQKKINRMTGK